MTTAADCGVVWCGVVVSGVSEQADRGSVAHAVRDCHSHTRMMLRPGGIVVDANHATPQPTHAPRMM